MAERHGFFNFRGGVLIVHAGRDFRAIQVLLLGPVLELGVEVFERDLFLVLVNPIVIIPEGGLALAVQAAARDGTLHGPRMNGGEREVQKIHAHFVGEGGRYILAQLLFLLLAEGTLEIAEHDQFDRGCIGTRAVARLAIGLERRFVGFERTHVDVVGRALDDILAVLRHVIHVIFGRAVIDQMHADVEETVDGRRGLGVVDLYRDLRDPQFGVTQVGFERCLVQC